MIRGGDPRKSPTAASLARFAETGKPASPFQRALMRAWTRIEDIITEEFTIVLHEETAAAYQSGLEEGRRERGQRPAVRDHQRKNDELRRHYRPRERGRL